MNKVALIGAIGLLLLPVICHAGDLPSGWYQHNKGQDSKVETGVDTNVYFSEPSSFYLKCSSGLGGNINQKIAGSEYAGKRIRLSAYLKSTGLVNDKGYGWQLWAYSYSDNEPFMRSATGNIKGTSDWAEYHIVFDIPKDNPSVTYGLFVTGQGTVWIDNIEWEVVDKSTPLKSSHYVNVVNKPKNLP